MRLLQVLCTIFLTCAAALAAFSQESDVKNKSKEKDKNKNAVQPLEVRANLTVLDSAGKSADDVKIEDLRIFEDGVEQKITYFTKKQPDLNLGLVFDNSGSMRKTVDVLTGMPAAFTDFLTQSDSVFAIRFIDSEAVEVIEDWTSDKKKLNEAIGNMYVQGGVSAVLDAVYLSAQKVTERETRDRSRRSAIILISDAEERDSYYSLKDIEKVFAGSDTQVFVLSFAENAPQQKKRARFVSNVLTLRTGGTTFTMPKKFTRDDIAGAVRRIAAELRSPYIIGYTSTNPNRDGGLRKLTVQIADTAQGEKRHGLIREEFVVPKD